MDPDAFLCDLLQRQHSFLTPWDLRAAGLSRSAAQHRVRRGDFEVHGPRVLRARGAPWTKASPLMRAVLDAGAGAVLDGPAALAWWRIPGFGLDRIDVTRPRGATGVPARYADVLHEVVDLTTNQVTVLDGIPIVRPDRLAFSVHAWYHPLKAARIVEAMWSRRLVSGASLRTTFLELGGQGRAGTVATREFLESHPDDWVAPASNHEARVSRGLAEAGLGTWRRQVDLGGTNWTGRVDFKHATLPLVLEVQSELYHAALVDREADARRKARLEADGFTVLEIWDHEIWADFRVVVDRVRAAMRDVTAALARRWAA